MPQRLSLIALQSLQQVFRFSSFRTSIYRIAIIAFLLVSPDLSAQRVPNCDVSCGGAGSTPNIGTVVARGAITADRGMGRAFASSRIAGTLAKKGSQSFTYAVPIMALPGRGLNLNVALYYNSFLWTSAGNTINLDLDRDTPSYGFRLDFGFIELAADDNSQGVITESNGTKHPLASDPSSPGNLQTTDSTYAQVQFLQTGDLLATYKSGLKEYYQSFTANQGVDYRPYKIVDTNGNMISIAYLNTSNLLLSSITDTVGRMLHFYYDPGETMLACIATVTNCDSPATTLYTFDWNTNYLLNFSFTKSSGSVLHSGSSILNVLTGVHRQDGTSVRFSYGDWAIVNKIEELSAAGNVRYSTSFNFPPASAGALGFNPAYTQQTVFDGVNTEVWNFSSQTNAVTGMVTSMAITDPFGTINTTSFSSKGDWEDGLPITMQVSASPEFSTQQACIPSPCPVQPPVVLQTVKRTWTADASTSFNPRPMAITTTLDDGSQSEVDFVDYDSSGNITDFREYDYGANAHGILLREVFATYANLGNGIRDRIADLQVKDGNGNLASHKKFNYDEGTLAFITGFVSGRDSNLPSTIRGNLTSTVAYANPVLSTGPITTTFKYDGLGNQINAQDGCCTFIQRGFSAATQYAYPDSVVAGPAGNQLTTTLHYNIATGTVSSSTDSSGNITTFQYDVDNRVISTQTPDTIVVSGSYDDFSALPAVSTSSSANSAVTKTTFDGRGRKLSSQILNNAVPVSTQSFMYDGLGRVKEASNPYGPTDSPKYTSYSYDPLGRTILIQPPPSHSGAAQNAYQAFYSGPTVTSIDPANKMMKRYKNALGQLVRVDEPGLISGQNASATLAVLGGESSVPSTSQADGATAGSANLTVTSPSKGTCPSAPEDKCSQILTHAATPSSITVTVGGQNGTNVTSTLICPIHQSCRTFTVNAADSGSMWFSVNAGGTIISTSAVPYGSGSSQSGLADALAGAFPANSLVQVLHTLGTNSFTLQSIATGTAPNSDSISTSIATNCSDPGTDNTTVTCNQGWSMSLSGPSLPSTTASSASFSGGTVSTFRTSYDTGTVTASVTINGTLYTRQANYNQSSTAVSVMTDLVNGFSDQTMNKLLIASVSGNVLTLTSLATGAGTNYPFSVSAATNSPDFPAGSTSFVATPSGAAFVPGQNGILFDSGTITATLQGFSTTPFIKTVNFGQGSTPASVAASIAAAFQNDSFSPVDANAPPQSSTITFKARAQGTDGNNYSVGIVESSNHASAFTTPSFPSVSAQLASGAEPTPSLDPSAALTTTYTYDNNQFVVHQGQQTRTYIVDGLGRVTSVTLPESGYQPSSATYTDFGAVAQVVDSRLVPGTNNHVTATLSYDQLNRLTSVGYNDGSPGIAYSYNPPGSENNTGGRLASVTTTNTLPSLAYSEAYQYDVMGRATLCAKTIAGGTYNVRYVYHADGTLASTIYPSGRLVTTDEDAIGRLAQVSSNGNSVLRFNAYDAAYNVLNLTYGNDVTGAFTYNDRLQLSAIQYGPATSPVLSLSYDYGDPENNGQIHGITDNLTPQRSTSYAYDELRRLKTAQTTDILSPNTWKLHYTYDRYGNRLSEIPEAGTGNMPMSELLVDPATNHITSSGFAYDAVGNLTSDGVLTYVFNAANQINSVRSGGTAIATFAYDPAGFRVIKNGTVYVYSNGKVIAEYAAGAPASTPLAEHVYSYSQRIATFAAGNVTYHYPDHLSTRIDANASGTVTRAYGHYPFGTTWYETTNGSNWKFTSYESDPESGLNYASARYQSPRVGRFLAMDAHSGRLRNPQSLNRYSYVGNDPINFVDPSGMDGETGDGFENSDGNFATLQDEGDDPPGSGIVNGWIFTGLCASGPCDAGSGTTVDAGSLALAEITGNLFFVTGDFSDLADSSNGGSQSSAGSSASSGAASGSSDLGGLSVEGVQGVLGVVGMVPVIGEAANLINAGISAYNGNYGTAAMYAAGALLPIGGSLLGDIAIAAKEVETVSHLTALESQIGGASVFYSGPGALEAATRFANEIGGTTIWGSEFGRFFNEGLMGAEEASAGFAREAVGEVHVFSTNPFHNYGNIWYNVERPALWNNPNVTNIVLHTIF